MNWQKTIAIAFGLALFYGYFPTITMIAGIILLVVFYKDEIATTAGKTVSFAKMFLITFGLAVGIQVLFTVLFGASFHELWTSGGLIAALKTPGALKAALIKEVFALAATACAVYLILTAEKISRPLLLTVMSFCIACMAYQCWDAYAPMHANGGLNHQKRLSMLREEVLANVDSHIKKVGLSLNRNMTFNEHVATMPTVYYALAGAHLYLGDSTGLKAKQLVEVGSQWAYVIDGEVIVDSAGYSYLPVSSFDEANQAVGYLRIDKMSKKIPKVKKVQAPRTVIVRVPANPVEEKVTPASALRPRPLAPAKQVEAKTPVADSVLVTANNWVATSIIPKPRDSVGLSGFSGETDISRLEVRNGNFVTSSLKPKDESGKYVVIDFNQGGNNSQNNPLELKLKHGLPLQVAVRQL